MSSELSLSLPSYSITSTPLTTIDSVNDDDDDDDDNTVAVINTLQHIITTYIIHLY